MSGQGKMLEFIKEAGMKKTLIWLSIISVVILFSIGCTKPKQEETINKSIDEMKTSNEEIFLSSKNSEEPAGSKQEETINDFFNGMEMSNEELFLSSLDSESLQIWKELNCPISDFSKEKYIWKLEKIEDEDSTNAIALIKKIKGKEKEYFELSLIKEESNWKIQGKEIILKLAYSLTSSCAGNLRSLGMGILCYFIDYKRNYPPNLEVLFKLGYIESLPKCPICGEDYIYKVDSWDSEKFEVLCPCPGKHQADSTEVKKLKILKYASGKGVILQ